MKFWTTTLIIDAFHVRKSIVNRIPYEYDGTNPPTQARSSSLRRPSCTGRSGHAATPHGLGGGGDSLH
jgi:hypothetical protein